MSCLDGMQSLPAQHLPVRSNSRERDPGLHRHIEPFAALGVGRGSGATGARARSGGDRYLRPGMPAQLTLS